MMALTSPSDRVYLSPSACPAVDTARGYQEGTHGATFTIGWLEG